MDQDILIAHAVLVDGHNLELDPVAVEPDTFVSVLAEDHLAAVFDYELVVGRDALISPVRECLVVVNNAVLDDFDE